LHFYFKGLPEGVVPLFLSSKTQEIFHCRMDEDVTIENPIKIITKDEIMEDLRMRAGICDFAPLKQEIIVRCYRFNATDYKFFTK
jgi:hypothetical protein